MKGKKTASHQDDEAARTVTVEKFSPEREKRSQDINNSKGKRKGKGKKSASHQDDDQQEPSEQ